MRLATRVALALCCSFAAPLACDFGIDLSGLTDGSVDVANDAIADVVNDTNDALPPAMPAIQVSAGGAHTCAVRKDGTVTCWGANGGSDGRLGNGNLIDSSIPVLVSLLPDATRVAAGSTHTCALRKDKSIACWGNNTNGQLGDGSTASSRTPIPVLLMGGFMPKDFIAVSAGNGFTCAVRVDGQVFCFGATGDQLGVAGIQRFPDQPVPGIANAIDVECGSNHACALAQNGDVFCWGSNSNGQLGSTSDAGTMMTPVQVPLAAAAVSISAGSTHTCAALANGEVDCWGNNTNGQLGIDNSTSTATPTKINLANQDFVSVSTGTSHSCATSKSGSVYCWGINVAGQLGTGDTTQHFSPIEVKMTMLANASAGSSHTCALTTTGSIACWGHNGNGRIGIGTKTYSATPTAVTMLDGTQELAVGADHSCARASDAGVVCWGDNAAGQMGFSNGALAATSVPIASPLTQALAKLSAGGSHTCALADGGAFCWGANSNGQLGNGSNSNNYGPQRFGGMAFGANAIVAGNLQSCAIGNDAGFVACSGSNGNNQLGTGGGSSTNVPTGVLRADGGLTGATAITSGPSNTCAFAGSEVLCWGLNDHGQTNATNKAQVQVATPLLAFGDAGIPPTISLGGAHTCAIRASDKKVLCWGSGTSGQLGDGTLPTDRTSPGLVMLPNVAAKDVANGSSHSCALLTNEEVWCWGAGLLGQMGNGKTDPTQPIPALVPNLKASEIAAGGDDTCAIVSGTKTVVCWGANVDGQLGDGTPVIVTTPATVLGY